MEIISVIKKTGAFITGSVMRNPIKFLAIVLCLSMLAYFEIGEPMLPLPACEWNIRGIKKIMVADHDNFSFAVFGENLNSKIVFENVLKMIDHDPQVAFAVSLGDMVSRGKKLKYHFFIKQVKNHLAIPLLTTMGSRELKGEGRSLYYDIFGSSNYSFHIGKNYFLILDDVGKEGLDHIQKEGWLENCLSDSQRYDKRFVFMHMPLCDPRVKTDHGMKEVPVEQLKSLFFRYHITQIFASNIHGYFRGAWDGIPYYITGGAGATLKDVDPTHSFFHFLKVNIREQSVNVEVKLVPYPDYAWIDRISYYISFFNQYIGIHLIEFFLIFTSGGLFFLVYLSESERLHKP